MKAVATFFFSALLAHGSVAQDVEGQQRAPLQFRVVQSLEVDQGDRSIFYNRVETPALKPVPPPPEPPAEADRPPSLEELRMIREWNSKPTVALFLSCTVYDQEVTYVQWWHEGGEYVLWSSIDFNYLRGLMNFETASARYMVFMGIGDESRKEVEEWNKIAASDPELQAYARRENFDFSLPLPPRRIPGATAVRSAYQFVSVPATGIDPEARRALDALHRHFDANREELVGGFEASEAERIAHEQWLKDNPPVPKDTTISYFPIRSDRMEQTKRGGK